MDKIKILAIPPDKHGVGKFRIIDPYTFIDNNYNTEFKIDLVYDTPNDISYFNDYHII